MVKNVGEGKPYFRAETLVDLDILVDGEIHIPVRQATESSTCPTVVTIVQTQDWVTETVERGSRILKYIVTKPTGTDAARASNAIMPRVAEVIRADENGALKGAEVGAIRFAKGLATAVDPITIARGTNHKGQARGSSENGRESPSAQDASNSSLLAFVEGRLVNEEDVVREFAVPTLTTVAAANVVWIRNGELAGGLNRRSGSQRLAPRKVRLHGQAVPIRHFVGHEQGIVIPITYARVDADPGGELSLGAARGGDSRRAASQGTAHDGRVHHGAGKVERAIVQIAPQAPDVLAGEVAGPAAGGAGS